jgi:NodT family efflux transporter outer membrane factor (OMF) lipoprotein
MPPCWNLHWYGRVALTGLAAASFGACAATPAAQRVAGAVTVPERWQATSTKEILDTAALAKWWERFHDPALNELISAALAGSPDVRAAVSKIAESRARRGVERASLFPWLTGGGSAQTTRQENRTGTNSQTGTSSTTRTQTYSGSLDASWQVDLFGKQWLNVKAATSEIAQATENLYAAQVSLAAEVADAYLTLRAAEEQLSVVERSVNTRSETLKITQWREQAGQGNALDTVQTLSTLENARAAIPSLQETIGQTRNRLALLVGRTPGGVTEIVAKTRPIPTAIAFAKVGVPAETLRQRPDVRAAEQAVYAGVARTKSAQRERLPSLNISGTLSTESLSSGRIFNPQSLAASLLGSLVIPIFKGGEITANIQIRTEQERQALLAYEKTVLSALSEVEDALISVQRQIERLQILDRAVDAARQAQKLSQQRYNAGEVDILSVLETERTLLSAEVELVNTRVNRSSAQVQLYKALGGGWSLR